MKQLVIMRGLPGSGKSTEGRKLVLSHIEHGGQTAAICSTDSLFLNKDGEYVFDPTRLAQHHRTNQYKANRYMFMGTELVIIDNTNTTYKEMAPYRQSARDNGYSIIEILIGEQELFPEVGLPGHNECAGYIDMCVERNTHNVPRVAIERMAQRFER